MVRRSDRDPVHRVFEVVASNLAQSPIFFYIPQSHRVVVARAQHDVQFFALLEAKNRLLVQLLFG